MRALASVGVFTEAEKRGFALTPLAETLRTDATGSLRAFATRGVEVPDRVKVIGFDNIAESEFLVPSLS